MQTSPLSGARGKQRAGRIERTRLCFGKVRKVRFFSNNLIGNLWLDRNVQSGRNKFKIQLTYKSHKY
jgi:hypothetical protein